MRIVVFCSLVFVAAGSLRAEEKEPFAARTTPFLHQPPHTHERAGTVNPIRKYATGSVTGVYSFGYIGGGKLVHGDGPGRLDGTFGTDYVGLGYRPGRVFLGWFHDRPKQGEFLPKYERDGPRVEDVVAAAPFKKAIREAKAEHKERKAGGEQHP